MDKTYYFFDLDGTLINTNYANFLSYKIAIQKITGIVIDYNPNVRFTREELKTIVPNLSMAKYKETIQLKNKLYNNFLHETKVNNMVAAILEKYRKIGVTVLTTNCRKERALITLEYHRLIDKFKHKFYRQKKYNKYEKALISLKISPASVFVFENEQSEIDAAISEGIPHAQIISI